MCVTHHAFFPKPLFYFSCSNMTHTLHRVLLVGQLYLDTILHVDHFPEEDSKLRANKVEKRLGGNTCNTAQVLAQFHRTLQVHYLSAVGSRASSQ